MRLGRTDELIGWFPEECGWQMNDREHRHRRSLVSVPVSKVLASLCGTGRMSVVVMAARLDPGRLCLSL